MCPPFSRTRVTSVASTSATSDQPAAHQHLLKRVTCSTLTDISLKSVGTEEERDTGNADRVLEDHRLATEELAGGRDWLADVGAPCPGAERVLLCFG
jgi:hypothetical protein